jgi:4-diphosphocytidyl-2-C-methyl-D-erythritol kinase
VFQAVSLYEDVIATPADDFTISVSGVADPSTVPLDDRNLAMRAKVLAAATGYDGGVHLDVHKSVPVAGGMGAGPRTPRPPSSPATSCGARASTTGACTSSAPARRRRALRAHGRHRRRLRARRRADPALSRGRYEWVLLLDDEGCPRPRCTGPSTW